MGTTADKLNRLIDTKEAIKAAIIDKGVSVTDTDTFNSYASKISEIDTAEAVEALTVSPTLEQQVITAPEGLTGYTPVTVEAISAESEPTLIPENIRAGVTIFGVTGTLDGSAEAMQEIDNLLETLYPVGSLYIGTQTSCPLATLMPNATWVYMPASGGAALWMSNGTSNANTTIAPGLPNIKGEAGNYGNGTGANYYSSGAMYVRQYSGVNGESEDYQGVSSIYGIDASRYNPIYGASTTVQPPAYVVNVWRRTA